MQQDQFQLIVSEESSLSDSVKHFTTKLRATQRTEQDESIDSCYQIIHRSIKVKKTQLSVRVQLEQNRWMAVPYEQLTNGWLLSEIIRKLKPLTLSFDPEDIVGFRTGNVHLDFHLSCLHLPIPKLNNVILQPMIAQFRDQVNLESFEMISKIGSGGFSVVYLVRKLDNGVFYAMKVIDKKLMIDRDKEEMIFNERQILSKMNHQRVVQLHYAFQTRNKLFFVMEYCPGGELYYHLRKRKRFTEEETNNICRQVVSGLEYLHSLNILYRDLKPENILIDVDGMIKLADFGLGKQLPQKESMTYSFCGSLEYMAPEMIKQEGHTFALDHYMLGVLIYELVTGLPPFYAKTRADMLTNIVNKEITCPKFISDQMADFIQRLCQKNHAKRLGAKGIQEIINHPWLKGPIKRTPIAYSLEEFNFDKIFTKQGTNLDGPRCLSEEFQLQKQDDNDLQSEHFASFDFKR